MIAARFEALFLGAGLALGVQSCLFFAWSLAFGTAAPGLGWIDATLLAIAVGLWVRARKRDAVHAGPVSPDRPQLVLAALFAVTAVASVTRFAIRAAAQPHGHWDAWAIWNLHARWIARGGDDWLGFLSLEGGQPSYPLLLPAAIAEIWLATGHESVAVPIGVGAFFAVATVGLLVSALAATRTLGVGLVGGIALLATPQLVVQAAAQQADVPLGFFALATAVCLHRALAASGRRHALLLAGAGAGLAAWTKDEGWLLVAVSGVVLTAHSLLTDGFRAALRRIAWFAAGLAPIALVAGSFKLWLAPQGWLTKSSTQAEMLARVTDFARAGEIAAAFVRGILELGRLFERAPLLLSVPVLLLLYPWVVTRRPSLRRDSAALAVLALVGGVLAGYAGVYLVTPKQLDWQLTTSLSRLLLQIWPAALFGWLLLVPAPERGSA